MPHAHCSVPAAPPFNHLHYGGIHGPCLYLASSCYCETIFAIGADHTTVQMGPSSPADLGANILCNTSVVRLWEAALGLLLFRGPGSSNSLHLPSPLVTFITILLSSLYCISDGWSPPLPVCKPVAASFEFVRIRTHAAPSLPPSILSPIPKATPTEENSEKNKRKRPRLCCC
ncbi:hypothetical protein L211DRAFT_438560 [Terfezia boudieri ATCC MYA-4762]|uniref:Uncharacterized protein n=1 Tax=Terfezia boudieri ATCC MYA-4762 TaxID=1051890 RepID=A0A3N4LJ82_9PEZI|nr:hypothetical protein L211DRAFT_438560 [Terfezia boudieri ATCC MYA-4762]